METPLILILVIVAPLWIILHYVTTWKKTKGLSAEDETNLGQLRRNAERLEDRLHTLERILDDEVPDWRQKFND